MTLVTDIKKYRQRAKMTQREVAAKADLTIAAVSRIENGHTLPTLDTYVRILDAMGYEINVIRKVR